MLTCLGWRALSGRGERRLFTAPCCEQAYFDGTPIEEMPNLEVRSRLDRS